jgi:hypothetical protein
MAVDMSSKERINALGREINARANKGIGATSSPVSDDAQKRQLGELWIEARSVINPGPIDLGTKIQDIGFAVLSVRAQHALYIAGVFTVADLVVLDQGLVKEWPHLSNDVRKQILDFIAFAKGPEYQF